MKNSINNIHVDTFVIIIFSLLLLFSNEIMNSSLLWCHWFCILIVNNPPSPHSVVYIVKMRL